MDAQLVSVLLVADTADERDLLLRALVERAELAFGPRSALTGGVFEVGELRIDTPSHRVSVSGQEIRLTALEFRLLATLAERSERVQSRATLLSDVWGITASNTRTIDTHVKRLREKLGTAGRFIQVVRGVGYRLSARPEAENVRRNATPSPDPQHLLASGSPSQRIPQQGALGSLGVGRERRDPATSSL